MKNRMLLFALLLFVVYSDPGFAAGKSGDYRLGPEDVLRVSVWRDEELSMEVVVRPDGYISFPLVRDIKAGGRTVEQVRAEIQDKIKEYVPDAPVTVMLIKVVSPKFYVVGKVNRPGVFILGQKTTVLQALSLAGGTSSFAGKSGIRIIRPKGNGHESLEFDYDDVTGGDGLEQIIYLEPGDTVVVP